MTPATKLRQHLAMIDGRISTLTSELHKLEERRAELLRELNPAASSRDVARLHAKHSAESC